MKLEVLIYNRDTGEITAATLKKQIKTRYNAMKLVKQHAFLNFGILYYSAKPDEVLDRFDTVSGKPYLLVSYVTRMR